MTRCIDCGGEIIEGEDHRCHTRFDWPMTTIIIEMEDEPVHTAANGYTCGQPDCPCSAEVEDEIRLSPPTEEQLDAQEQTAGPRRIDWSKIFA